MAHLSAYSYTLLCTKRGQEHFGRGSKDGVLICLAEGENVIGVGEYAPLAGIHHDTMDDLVAKTHKLKPSDLAFLCSLPPGVTTDDMTEIFAPMSGSLGHVLSMAHFHSQQKARPCDDLPLSIKLSALIEAWPKNIAVEQAQQHLAQGFTCLKIKVGRFTVADEIDKIKTIAAIGGNRLTLRLDGNKRMTLDSARTLLNGIKRVKLEYFEEPTMDFADAKHLHEEFGIDIAIDESLVGVEDYNWVKFIIVKPSRFGSIYQVMKLAERAHSLGKTVIFSHCFESDYSAAIYALMINHLGLNDHAHGILAVGFFRYGIFREPLRSFRGTLPLKTCREAITTRFWDDAIGESRNGERGSKQMEF